MASIDTFESYQGDTTKIKRIYPEGMVVDENWTASLTVLDDNSKIVLSKELTDINDGKFRVYLTPSETGNLDVGTYTMGVQLKNLTLSPPFVREVHYDLVILDQVVA